MLMRLVLAIAILATTSISAHEVASSSPTSDLEQCRKLGLQRCPVPFDVVLPPAHDMLTWSQEERVVGFRNTYRQYAGDVFHADPAHVYALTSGAANLSPRYNVGRREFGLEDYVKHQSVTGLLVLQDGHIAYEHYAHGNTETTLWTSRSVAKSVVSVLVGIAIHEGRIKSVDDQITAYLPELRKTAWDGVSLRNLLQHTSGVAWNENYADPKSDFAKLTHCEASADAYNCVLQLVRGVARKPGVKPGDVWSYNTGGAWLVGRVLERATGMPIAKYLETRLWQRFGMEHDGVWEALRAGEVDMGGHGFNATLRDWGRFGLFVARGGVLPNGEALLPTGWLIDSTRWTKAKGSVDAADPDGQYGYQWWHQSVSAGSDPRVKDIADRSLWAEGIYGQVIGIDPIRKLVMVQWSTYKDADGSDALAEEQLLFFAALQAALTGDAP